MKALFLAVLLAFSAGCASIPLESIPVIERALDQADSALDAAIAEEEAKIAKLEAAETAPESPETPTSDKPSADIPAGTMWLHGGGTVAGWPVTANLSSVSIGNGSITLNHDKANAWPTANLEGGVNANPWVFVNVNGQWYAATWEWMRTGQTTKNMRGKSWGGHIKAAPLDKWEPRSGERIGWMVSGLARSAVRNVKERSNIVWKEWP